MTEQDWTGDTESAADAHRLMQKTKAVEFANLYTVFEDDERGRQLLAHWDKVLMNKRVPVHAPLQEYAAVEAVRDFVASIHRELERAHGKV